MSQKTRRNNGEGTIIKIPTKNGYSFHARTSIVDPETQKKITIKRSGRTRAEAQKNMQKAKENFLNRSIWEKENITVKQWIEKWLNNYASHKVKVKTFEGYESSLRCYISDIFGESLLKNITTDFLQEHLKSLEKSGKKQKQEGLSPHTIKTLRRILISCLNQAVKLDYLKENPARDTTSPRTEQKEIQVLNETEVELILLKAKEHSLYAYALLSLEISSGIRLGEIFGLKWKDINFSTNEITINQSLSLTSTKGKFLQPPKTKLSRRTLIIPKGVMEIIKAYKKKQDNHKHSLGDLYEDNGLVFPNQLGKLADTKNFTKRTLRKILKAANIRRKFTFHDFRHTHATLLLEKNVPMKVIQNQLGHSSITTTMNVYGHITPDLKEMPAEALGNLWK